jgi:hypothetical protein
METTKGVRGLGMIEDSTSPMAAPLIFCTKEGWNTENGH